MGGAIPHSEGTPRQHGVRTHQPQRRIRDACLERTNFKRIPCIRQRQSILHHPWFPSRLKVVLRPLEQGLRTRPSSRTGVVGEGGRRGAITAPPSVDSTLLVSRRRFILQAVGAKQTLEPLQQTCAIIPSPEESSFNHTPIKKHIGARDALRISRCIWTTKPDCRRR